MEVTDSKISIDSDNGVTMIVTVKLTMIIQVTFTVTMEETMLVK